MEHITIKEIGGGFVRLIAEDGYELYSITLNRVFPEAIVKESEEVEFVAVKKK